MGVDFMRKFILYWALYGLIELI
ncbi:TPA_asm: membrane protein FxsA, partial [Listeria monocytogenes]|nr:membrane protein FxsA [Listeria monocytogenes]